MFSRVPATYELFSRAEKEDGPISDDQLAELLAALKEGARLALRFQAEGISSQPGPRPRWLEACTSHLITGLSAGSAVLARCQLLRRVASIT